MRAARAPATYDGFRDYVMQHSPYRIFAFLNVSFPGIFGFDKGVSMGEARLREMLPVDRCVAKIEANRDRIVGVKVRIGGPVTGDLGLGALELALEAAERRRPAADDAYRHRAAELRRRRLDAASGRHPHPLLPAGAEFGARRRRQGAEGGARGARARRAVRHRPWHGRLRLRDDGAGAEAKASCPT